MPCEGKIDKVSPKGQLVQQLVMNPVAEDLPDPQETPRLLLDGTFDDILAFGQAAGWDLDFRQLEPGPLEASLLIIGHPGLILTRFEFNRAYHQLGRPPAGFMTFGLPDLGYEPLLWNGAVTPANVLINFSHSKGLDAVNRDGGFSGYVVSFSLAVLESMRRAMGLPADLVARSMERRFSDPSPERADELRGLYSSLVASARTGGDAGLARWAGVFNYDLPSLVLRCQVGPELKPHEVLPRFRARALDRAVALLASHEQMPENVETLCAVAGASWATLLRAFKDSFGVSPKAYMKLRRLTAVREALLRGDQDERISDIANRWGFWHMGSLAADYRRQFGELPSTTRSRSRSDG